MDIMELGAIGELVGGTAVLATLAYLAVQVRHTRAQLDEQSLATTINTIYQAWEPAFHHDNMRVLRRGLEGADFDEDEAFAFSQIMSRILGIVLALERSDSATRKALTPTYQQLFSDNAGAKAWIDDARHDPGRAEWVAAYDRLVGEDSRNNRAQGA